VNIDLFRLGVLAATILALLGLTEAARRLFGWADEVTRKTVHVATGVLIFLSPPFVPHAGTVMLIAAFFVAVNALAYSRGWLKSVHHTGRASFGTVYYPLALLLLAVPFWDSHPDLVVAAIMVMAIGDAAAGMTGERIRKPVRFSLTSDTKSLQGSIAMAVGSLAALFATAFTYADGGLAFGSVMETHPSTAIAGFFAVSLFATAWEAVSSRGLDNLTVPLMSAAALHICFAAGGGDDALRFAIGAGLGLLVAVGAYAARMLQLSGAVATFLLATLIFGIGGWQWTLPIFTFFLLSSLLSKWRRRQKVAFETLFEKGGIRDAGQVAANGVVVGILALLWHFTGDDRLYLLSLVAVAVVTADTWGTEIGVLSRRKPRSIRTGRTVAPGTSGGISVSGTVGGITGATVVSLSALPFVTLSLPQFLGIVAFGAAGSMIDSLLGATVQAQFRCTICGKDTEQRLHCGVAADQVRGMRCVRNDAVNVLSTLLAVIVSAALFLQ
jgi:uncharacterized protein (TIGR00297 family)